MPMTPTIRLLCLRRTLLPKRCSSSLPERKVLVSTSFCPFENLALEDYFYEMGAFANGSPETLFVWRNDPCVVIGRHQNAWREVNMRLLQKRGARLCRRMSGGGAVYHDHGNVNLTFFSARDGYDRKRNLDVVTDALRKWFGVDVSHRERDDIVLDGLYKVSGTAAKLGLRAAYHHCTLLCDSDLASLSALLRTPFGAIDTNATASVSSKTANIFPGAFSFPDVAAAVADSYAGHGVRIDRVSPASFPTVAERVAKLKAWDWLFAKSPKFSVENTFADGDRVLIVKLQVVKGSVDEVEVCGDGNLNGLAAAVTGKRFSTNSIQDVCRETFNELENRALDWMFMW